MDPINLDTFRRNAYRILGLPAAATQEQIDSAARLMRLLSAGEVPPAENDLPLLGPVHRSAPDVEYAVMRLTDPQSRITERLWWYCDYPPTQGGKLPKAAEEIAGLRQRHDAALTLLCQLLLTNAAADSLPKWRQVLGDLRTLAESDKYRDWMAQVELDGDFEKGANPGEISEAQSQMAHQAATRLVALAEETLTYKEFSTAGPIISLLNEVLGDRGGPLKNATGQMLNRLDDELIGLCNECIETVHAAGATRRVDELKPACEWSLRQCNTEIAALLAEIVKWSPDDGDRKNRLKGEVVRVYVLIADGFEACMDSHAARTTLQMCMEIARGTPMEQRLVARIHGLKQAKRPKTSNAAKVWNSAPGRWGGIAAGIMLLNVLRMCATSTTNPSIPNNYYDRDMRTPSFNPIPVQYRTMNPLTQPWMPEPLIKPSANKSKPLVQPLDLGQPSLTPPPGGSAVGGVQVNRSIYSNSPYSPRPSPYDGQSSGYQAPVPLVLPQGGMSLTPSNLPGILSPNSGRSGGLPR